MQGQPIKNQVIDGEFAAQRLCVLSSHPSRCIRIGYDLLNGCRDEAAREIKAIEQKTVGCSGVFDVEEQRDQCTRTEGCIRAVMAIVINVRVYHKSGRCFKVFINQIRVLQKKQKI